MATASAPTAKPIRVGWGTYLRGGFRNLNGTVVLFPDRLGHASSYGAAAAFGAIGQMVSRMRAPGRVAKGSSRGVTVIPLADIVSFNKASWMKLSALEVHTRDGGDHKFRVPYDRWAPDLAAALQAQGVQVAQQGDGWAVAPANA